GRLPAHRLQGGGAVRDRLDGEPVPGCVKAQQFPDVGIVVDHQYPGLHRRSPPEDPTHPAARTSPPPSHTRPAVCYQVVILSSCRRHMRASSWRGGRRMAMLRLRRMPWLVVLLVLLLLLAA